MHGYRRTISGLLIVAALLIGCATANRHPHAAAVGVALAARTNAARALPLTPAWQLRLPGSSTILSLAVSGKTVLIIRDATVVAVDAADGHARWQAMGGLRAALTASAVYISDRNGGIVARKLRDGTVMWHARHVCENESTTDAVLLIRADRNDVFSGCHNGSLIRLDASTGAKRAQWSFDERGDFQSIDVLPEDVIAVRIVTDGAMLVSHLKLLRRSALDELVADSWSDGSVLGVVNHIAVINDQCCFGRYDQPVQLSYVNLKARTVQNGHVIKSSGTEAPWRGSTAAITAGHLYTSRLGTFDDDGDPLAPHPPQRLAGGLGEPAQVVFGHDVLLRHAQAGRETIAPMDMNQRPMRMLWHMDGLPIVRLPTDAAPRAISVQSINAASPHGANVVLADGRMFSLSDSACALEATSPRMLFTVCRNGHDAQQVQAFQVR